MTGRTTAVCLASLNGVALCLAAGLAAFQAPPPPVLGDTFLSRDHPAIGYTTRTATDVVRRLNERLLGGQVRLAFDPDSGYLKSVLTALDVPVESQVAVFSKTSLQSERIGPQNPRVIFFNDRVAVAWPRGGFIEVAAVDPEQGAFFYMLQQTSMIAPQFIRNDNCLRCHVSSATLGVPGLAVASVVPEADGQVSTAPTYTNDHRSPFEERWGGWYVTGARVPMRHMGNLVAADADHPAVTITKDSLHLDSLSTRLDTRGYPSTHSDIVALMVLDHQTRMIDLLTRIGWEVRVGLSGGRGAVDAVDTVLRAGAREIVDYMLFVDEAPLSGEVEGASGFAETFSTLGPRDHQGRSLRDLDLNHRLLRYPCSYLIYSDQFDHLPAQARDAIYRRMWEVLSGAEKDPKYARLSLADRKAIVEILRDTKKGLPQGWTTVTE